MPSIDPKQPAAGLAAGSVIFLTQATIFLLLYIRQLVIGEPPAIAWILGAAFGFPLSATLLYWAVNTRGAKRRPTARDWLLTVLLLVVTGTAIYAGLSLIAQGR